jgi:hypothetical protein
MPTKKTSGEPPIHKPMGRPKKEGARANVTMQWPIEFTERLDEAAHKRRLSRTQFVLQEMEKVIAHDDEPE